jgi:peptidoglycan/LPS O-acetylase OafA/YrhL
VYLDRISYGIYLYHVPLHDLVKLDSLPAGPIPKEIIAFVAYTALTLAVASLSWLVIERPVNRLKERVAYSRARGTPAELARTGG